ncbi:hypothetical protein [Candidatus Magnetominusculus xianensis]|uniref:hypothetical protein n=1 Tax=Candidatus Magnetominusculus xianensis TaxID=1748249 RepID=UPI0012EE6BE8|nr:hypothetical protein [Candidatus Magnetominusculus xianensis]MBF0402988.1 hypothetical protein [Nitrospirota bacterium]
MMVCKKLCYVFLLCILIEIVGIGTAYAGSISVTSDAVAGTGIYTVSSAILTQSSTSTITLTFACSNGCWTGIITPSITAGTSDYSLNAGSTTCGVSQAPGSCNISVVFSPTDTGTRTGTLNISFGVNGANTYDTFTGFATTTGAGATSASATITLTGTGLAVPTPTMSGWGMTIFMVFAGIGSVYYFRKVQKINKK